MFCLHVFFQRRSHPCPSVMSVSVHDLKDETFVISLVNRCTNLPIFDESKMSESGRNYSKRSSCCITWYDNHNVHVSYIVRVHLHVNTDALCRVTIKH